MSALLFVYGTLKRGCSNHTHLSGQRFVGNARTLPGYSLFDLGGYPGIAPSPANLTGVSGEVWSVEPDALARLDDFEGVAEGLYRRERLPLQPPFATESVEAYFPVLPVDGRPELGPVWVE